MLASGRTSFWSLVCGTLQCDARRDILSNMLTVSQLDRLPVYTNVAVKTQRTDHLEPQEGIFRGRVGAGIDGTFRITMKSGMEWIVRPDDITYFVNLDLDSEEVTTAIKRYEELVFAIDQLAFDLKGSAKGSAQQVSLTGAPMGDVFNAIEQQIQDMVTLLPENVEAS